jgi:hypothetical protein
MKIQKLKSLEQFKTHLIVEDDIANLILPKHGTDFHILSMPNDKYRGYINKAVELANEIAEEKADIGIIVSIEDAEVCSSNEYFYYMCIDFYVHVINDESIVNDLKVTFIDDCDNFYEIFVNKKDANI